MEAATARPKEAAAAAALGGWVVGAAEVDAAEVDAAAEAGRVAEVLPETRGTPRRTVQRPA